MKLADTVSLAVRNLGQAKLRTALTTLGVSIGIASLAGMVSLGVGLQEQFVGRFTNAGLFDVITVTSTRQSIGGQMFGRGRGRGPIPFGQGASAVRGARAEGPGTGREGTPDPNASPPTPDPPLPPLDDAALGRLAALPQVRDVFPNIRMYVQITFEERSEFGTMVGVPLSTRGQGAFQTMAAGTFFENDTDRTCILSLDLATRMVSGEPAQIIGKQLTYAYAARPRAGAPAITLPVAPPPGVPVQVQRTPIDCRIIGVVERDPSPGMGVQPLVAGVMIPMAQARAVDADSVTSIVSSTASANRGAGYPSVTVKVTRSQFTQDVQAQVKALGYQAFSLNDALEGAKRAFIILDIVLGLIGSIALAVSSLGIVNTMVMSILERTREIGVMKAIGGSDADVRGIFLVEASTIGLMGGAAGIALGWTVGRIINIGANVYIERQGGTATTLFSMPWWLIATAIGFSLLISLIAGSYPASRAARLDPIQALRHD